MTDYWTDGSDNLKENFKQQIEFYHIPSGTSLSFKAYLTQFEDNYNSSWNVEDSFGKLDPIRTFQYTSRSISLGFDVVAGDWVEADNNLNNLNTLYRLLYPSYSSLGTTETIQAYPYFKVQFMNLLMDSKKNPSFDKAKESGLLGAISGFSFSPNLDEGVMQATEPDYAPDDNRIFPKALNITFQLSVLHEHRLGWSKSGTGGMTSFKDFRKFPYGSGPKRGGGLK